MIPSATTLNPSSHSRTSNNSSSYTHKHSGPLKPDFQAIVLCGYGESLFPLTSPSSPASSSLSSTSSSSTPKALIPILNQPLIDLTLQYIEHSGISDVLLLCPQADLEKIRDHVRENWPFMASGGSSSHQGGSSIPSSQGANNAHITANPTVTNTRRKRTKGEPSHLNISIHSLDENAHLETLNPSEPIPGTNQPFVPSLPNSPSGLNGDHGDVQPELMEDYISSTKRPNTARILRRWREWIKSDFVVLPCDLSPPSLAIANLGAGAQAGSSKTASGGVELRQLLDKHRLEEGSLVTSCWREKTEADLKDDDAAESVLLTYDKKTEELLLITPLEEMDDELELRMSLLAQHPNLSMTTSLIDTHIYIFRHSILDLIMTRQPTDLESLRENVLGWICKSSWQVGLRDRWSGILDSKNDPLAAAMAKSTTSRFATTLPPVAAGVNGNGNGDRQMTTSGSGFTSVAPTVPSSPMMTDGHKNGSSNKKRKSKEVRCNVVIWRPSSSSNSAGAAGGASAVQGKGGKQGGDKGKQGGGEEMRQEETFMRVNTVASYWELNRQFLKAMPPNLHYLPQNQIVSGSGSTGLDGGAESGGVLPNIDPKAQISPDSLVDPSSKIGERTSVKKSIIGRHCVIGKNVRLTGCIVWDFVVVADGAKIENTILCSNVRVGPKAQIGNSELGNGFEVPGDSTIKGERLVAGQEI